MTAARFAEAAARLAGFAGAMFGWSPDVFWNATPAEFGAVVRAVAGEAPDALDRAMLMQLMEACPDG